MTVEWDYTKLASAYQKRPEYSEEAISELVKLAGVKKGDRICDIGAGVGHLTIPLAKREFVINAVEPNDAMRALGQQRLAAWPSVTWFKGTGEETTQPDHYFEMATFGSSFNVCDREKALKEVKRIVKPHGWFACMWNHRDLQDPIQVEIENIIKRGITGYDYGTRREDQEAVINASKLYGKVHRIEGKITHEQTIDACVEAWRSHATLERQAKDKFENIVADIEKYLISLKVDSIKIPYDTKIWAAQLL